MITRLNELTRIFTLLFCGLMLMMPVDVMSADEPPCGREPMIFGILPFISADKLVAKYSPLTRYLSEKLQVDIRIETAPDFKEFNRRTLGEGRYDILFTAPHFYPPAHDKAGYRLLVGADSPGMWAVIVVPESSSIMKTGDLRGKKLAVLNSQSLVTLLVRKHLKESGLDPDRDLTLVKTPSHDASLLSSYHGVTDASALMSPPYESSSEEIRKSMRIIATTDSTPHIPISVSPKVSAACASTLTQLLLNLNETEKGRNVLKGNSFNGFKIVSQDAYDGLRGIMVK